jgi:polyisoprenoid-binding protein YceI
MNALTGAVMGILSTAVSVRAADLKVDAERSWTKVYVSATGHSFTGTLKKFTARVSGDPATLKPNAASFEWNFADLDTNEPKRDAQMLQWLEHGKSPNGSFRMSKSWVDQENRTWLQGTLRIHSISKQVAFPIEALKSGDRVKIDGQVWIDYRNFNLPVIRKAIISVDPKLRVSFHLEGDTK